MNGPNGCVALPLMPGALVEDSTAGNPSNAEPGLCFEAALETASGGEPATDLDPDEEAATAPIIPATISAHELAGWITPFFHCSEHILPPVPVASTGAKEQISGNPAEITKNQVFPQAAPGGMAAAQQVPMVLTNFNYEEGTAPDAEGHPLGIEYIESPPFEKPVSIEPPSLRSTRNITGGTDALIAPPVPATPLKLEGPFANLESFQVHDAQRIGMKSVETIEAHVQLLRSMDQDRLEVVVRPHGDTPLQLTITRADGQVQVQARCDRGDFALLEAHWPSIQSALAAQGIRVEPLQTITPWENQANHSTQGDDSQSRDSKHAAQEAFSFEQDPPLRKTGETARSATHPAAWRDRGWQRWA